METYGMITKKLDQIFVGLFDYPIYWALRQYIKISNFLIFGVFHMYFYIKCL